MRIRFKSDSDKSGEDETDETEDKMAPATAAPSISEPESGDAGSASQTEVATSSSATTTSMAAAANESMDVPKKKGAKERTAHLTGKINNLLTGDVAFIGQSYKVAEIRKFFFLFQLSRAR